MVMSDTSCMMDGLPLLYWHWDLGQVWAKLGLQKSRTTLGEMYDCTIVQLQTKDQMTSTMGISLKLCFHDITCRGKP